MTFDHNECPENFNSKYKETIKISILHTKSTIYVHTQLHIEKPISSVYWWDHANKVGVYPFPFASLYTYLVLKIMTFQDSCHKCTI